MALLRRMADDASVPDHLLLVEHLPVITCGRSGDGRHLLAKPEELAAKGIEYKPVRRGGDITYHGPGQWTVYPVVRLDHFGRDLHRYLRMLEESVILFLSRRGIKGERRKNLTGVWVERNKIAAVGVAVNRWIAWHGFAVNIQPDLSAFHALIVPCGIAAGSGGVTSLSALTGNKYDMEEIGRELIAAFADTCSYAPFPA